MQSIIKELWYGNIGSNENRVVSKEEQKLMRIVADSYDELQELLDAKQKEAFGKFEDSYSALRDIDEDETFAYAFRLGAKIAIEVMSFQVNAE